MTEQLSAEKAEILVEYWESGSKDDLESAFSIFTKAERYAASLFFLHLAIEEKLKAAYVKKIKPMRHSPTIYCHWSKNLGGILAKNW